MNIKQITRWLITLPCLVWCLGNAPLTATAANVYENYTFTTYAGQAETGVGWHDGPGIEAQFHFPGGVGADPQGNVYVADTANHTLRKVTPQGVVTTLAGNPGVAGAIDGTAGEARFSSPQSLAVGANGIIYVADTKNHVVRKVTPAGVVTTLAGKAKTPGSVNGTGANARFNTPGGVAVDGQGNVYVADTGNQMIRKISPAGVVTTVAGAAGQAGYANGARANARFYYPNGVAVDAHGNLFVADTANHLIRKITAAGNVSTLAGSANNASTTDGAGSTARFYQPLNLICTSDGFVYVADTYNHSVRKISPAGVVTTLAGLGGSLGNQDGTGNSARFNYPFSLTVIPGGNLIVADSYNNVLRQITPAGVTTTFAGSASVAGTTDGTRTNARFNYPSSVLPDNQGNLFVADFANHTIRKISAAGAVSTFAGSPGNAGASDGDGGSARFRNPAAIAMDAARNLYVADTYNHTIRKITPEGVVTTIAGTAGKSGKVNGTGVAARFNTPLGIAVNANGIIYVSDTWNHAIRKVTPAGVVTTFAGSAGNGGFANGTGAAARFGYPEGIAVSANGTIYVADTGNALIRKITPAGTVSTFAGSRGVTGGADGIGTAARFYNPFGVATDRNGYVYVADMYNSAIRRISPAGVVTTLAGRIAGDGNVDGTGIEARFLRPEGVAVDQSGTVYVADSFNHTIRVGYPALTDRAIVTPSIAGVGVARQLDIAEATTTSWAWSIIRAPGGSTAQLSATQVKNPTFTPDQPGVYVLRFQGWNSQGQAAIGSVTLHADATPPTLVITRPTPNLRTNNLVLKVTGTAKDNFAVGKVYVQHNGGAWMEATGTSNWSATVTLGAQTNTIRAYAVDTSGNASPIQSVNCYGVAFTPLSIVFSGQGTVTPNYQNARLEVGKKYSITATARTGYAFSHWTSNQDAGTNRPTYWFIMRSNLVLTAHFNDVGRPTLAITAPVANQRYTTENVDVSGTAADKSGVAQVFVRVNNQPWVTADGTTAWSVAAVLDPGTNRISAYAVDTVGNRSLTNSRLAVCAKYSGLKGTYSGLFLPDTSSQLVTPTNAGSLTVTLADIGAVSGKLILAGKTNRFTATLNGQGKADFQLQPAAPLAPLNIHLELRQDAAEAHVAGTVAGPDWSADLLAFATATQTVRTGKYTFLLDEGTPGDDFAPAGFSAGTITVKATGAALLTGSLADGTAISYGAGISAGGLLPVHIVLQRGKGLLIGWLEFVNDHFQGSLTWIKAPAAGASAKYYPEGFQVQRTLDSAKYLPPAGGVKLFTWTEGKVILEGGNLASPISIPVRLNNNLLQVVGSNPYKWTITINTNNGLVSGSFVHPTTRVSSTFKGAIVKDLDATGGWLLGTNQGGSIWIEGAP